jgi:hypothetical protein
MSAWAIGGVVFACVFGGAILGIVLRALLPERHLSADSKDVVRLGMGFLATMAALVLGLLIASAKGSYDTQRGEVTQVAANVVILDRILAHYGPQSKEARDVLRRYVTRVLDEMWPTTGFPSVALNPAATGIEGLYEKIQALSPQNDDQRLLRADARQITLDLGRTRSLLVAQSGSSIPPPFLVILIFWVTVLFASFGLFAPRNITVMATLFVCAVSVSGAIFLILELDQPFHGFIRVSGTPLRAALAHLGQ